MEPLAALVSALRDEEALAAAAIAHARAREELGLPPGEVVAELLVLGRVLERHGLREAREAVDWCILFLHERVTAELGDRARRDPLTGILNHPAFHAVVADELRRAARYGGRLALVLFDLDRFKETNDRLGHQEGDRLLCGFAGALAESVRESDSVGRLGGDEFGVLLLEGEPRAVDVSSTACDGASTAGAAASAGAAYAGETPPQPEELFALADRRLYADKVARAA